MSEPASTGVEVAVAVAFGRVAVCVPVPIDTKATFGPSFTIRMELPTAGSAVEVLAVDVTEIGSVSACAENGELFCISLAFQFGGKHCTALRFLRHGHRGWTRLLLRPHGDSPLTGLRPVCT